VVIVVPDDDDASRRERAAYDVGQASVQMMIAAAGLGIGSGHSAVGDQARAREILGFPEDRYAYIMIDFGYPADRPLAPIRRPDRRAFEEVVHRGRW
jgi:nitroreductase